VDTECQKLFSFLSLRYQVDIRPASFMLRFMATENYICNWFAIQAARILAYILVTVTLLLDYMYYQCVCQEYKHITIKKIFVSWRIGLPQQWNSALIPRLMFVVVYPCVFKQHLNTLPVTLIIVSRRHRCMFRDQVRPPLVTVH